jgi:hypothetical protein
MDSYDNDAYEKKTSQITSQIDYLILELLWMKIKKLSKENRIMKDYLETRSAMNN